MFRSIKWLVHTWQQKTSHHKHPANLKTNCHSLARRHLPERQVIITRPKSLTSVLALGIHVRKCTRNFPAPIQHKITSEMSWWPECPVFILGHGCRGVNRAEELRLRTHFGTGQTGRYHNKRTLRGGVNRAEELSLGTHLGTGQTGRYHNIFHDLPSLTTDHLCTGL